MIIKKPDQKHGWRLMQRVDGKYRTVNHSELEVINRDYEAGSLSEPRARALVQTLKDQLEADISPPPPSFLPENLVILQQFWDKEASLREQSEPRAAWDNYRWAISQLGATSLMAPKDALFAALKHIENPRQKARAVNAINAILTYKGMSDKRLKVPKIPHVEPIYLTLEEFAQVVTKLRPEERLAAETLLATGARYGEIFDLTSASLKEQGTHVYIGGQRKKGWVWKTTKNRKVGMAYVLPELRLSVKKWIMVPLDVKKAMRASGSPYDSFKAACVAIHRPELTLHKLRHSYTKIMIMRGATLMDLAKWLRDSSRTVETTYASWIETSSEMANNRKRFG